ncbi:hypothetical protein PDE_04740 [Penicillium oxalicum 114-2]|uniref:Uncharacterized protein n=1 Tax=Penicillium oxalicum (strain 114-2 / CGMCC 5302) TaxID=933388 RepID=S7ZGI1_PENO1|nr:hypothetical protein PDE_04740 [Penicillium oxalicum 114-2]
MHFPTGAAFISLFLAVTCAAPLSNSHEHTSRRKVTYEVVNVAGTSTTSVAPATETLTETIKSVTTATKVMTSPVTITVFATSTSKPVSSSVPSSHGAPPSGASSDILRRRLVPTSVPS